MYRWRLRGQAGRAKEAAWDIPAAPAACRGPGAANLLPGRGKKAGRDHFTTKYKNSVFEAPFCIWFGKFRETSLQFQLFLKKKLELLKIDLTCLDTRSYNKHEILGMKLQSPDPKAPVAAKPKGHPDQH